MPLVNFSEGILYDGLLTVQSLNVTGAARFFGGFSSRGPSPSVDAAAFGVVANGTNDDTSALQAAIDSLGAGGGLVTLPAGTILISSTIFFTPSAFANNASGVTIRGRGIDVTTILANQLNASLLSSKNTGSRYFGIRLQDFSVSNTSRHGAASGIGINLTNVSDSVVDNVRIKNVNLGIFAQDDSVTNDFRHVLIEDTITAVTLQVGTAPGTAPKECIFFGGKIARAFVGFSFNGTTNCTVFGTSIEDVTVGATLGITNPTLSTQLIGCRIENSATTYAITGATNANPIVITAVGHPWASGDSVVITGVGGNTAANTTATITRVDSNRFSLNGVAGNGAYTSGGAAAYSGTGVIQVSTNTAQLLLGLYFVNLVTKISGTNPADSMQLIGGRFKPGFGALTANSATPSVENGNHFVTANTTATTYTSFTLGQAGQRFTVLVNDAFSNFLHAGVGSLRLIGNGSIPASSAVSGSILEFLNHSGVFKQIAQNWRTS